VGDLHRLIAFDLDGTIVDSRRDLADSANELLVEFGGSPLPEEAIARMVGEGAATLVRRALTAAHLTDVRAASAEATALKGALARFLKIYDTRLLQHTRVYPGLADVVRFARTLGRVAVLTNKPLAPSERILEGLGIRDLFDEVTGGDGPLPRKPDPAGLEALMRSAGATPQTTLLVGDSTIDHETAVRAGVRCCLVSFGFGFDTFPKERLRDVDSVAVDAGELKKRLAKFAEETDGYFVRMNGSSYEK
jgi:phosphoglycolate phosphatase